MPANLVKLPTFIDLFSGCGGFTLGMLRAGFECVAAVDFNGAAIATLRENLQARTPSGLPPVGCALEADLTRLAPEELAALVNRRHVDVIVGGPPCQGFSTARQRDGSNHGTSRLKDDPRRHLFRNFLDHVQFFQPKVFVIENVLGLRSAGGGRYFTAVQHEARELGRTNGRPGYRVHAQVERAEEMGVPQKRRRQLIVGVRADLAGYFPSDLARPGRGQEGTMLGDAIMDLPPLRAGEGDHRTNYDSRRREVQFLMGRRDGVRRHYIENVAEVQFADAIYNHMSRPHNDRDLRDFERLREGENAAVAARKRGVHFEYPYSKETFKDRFTRQHRNRPCSTIVAHLSRDGLMFIHPVQNRSLTPREAARVQSFPDWFVFSQSRTRAFRQIGNAVPPLVAEAVGLTLRKFLSRLSSEEDEPVGSEGSVPADRGEAAAWLHPLMHADLRTLRSMPVRDFLRGWHALLWIFPHLHPENALEHGPDQHRAEDSFPELADRYTRTGWPVVLEPLGREAWRRYTAGEFAKEAFYFVPAQRGGLRSLRGEVPASC